MRLIPNAGRVSLQSYSMIANYLGIVCLVIPELIFWVFRVDTNPRIWWILGMFFILSSIAGRVIDQGLGARKVGDK